MPIYPGERHTYFKQFEHHSHTNFAAICRGTLFDNNGATTNHK